MMKKEKETSSQREIYLVDIGNDNGEVKGGTYLRRRTKTEKGNVWRRKNVADGRTSKGL